MKKLIALLLALSMMATFMVGCGQKTEAPAADKESTEAPAEEGKEETAKSDVTLTIMAPQDQIKAYEQETLAAAFTAETGIKVDYQIVPSDQFDALLATKLDTGACTDIFSSQSGALTMEPRYKVSENCVDLSDMEWVTRYNKEVLGSSSYDGKVYAQTLWDVFGGAYGVIYNKTIFAENGIEIPKTYEEFAAACETLVAAGVIPMYESVVDSWHPTCSYIEMFIKAEQNNPGTFEKLNNNEMLVSDIPEAVELTRQFKEVGQKYSGDTYMSNEFVNAAASLSTGEYAMTFTRPGLITEIADNYPDATYGEADFGVFALPYLDNQVRNVNPQGPSRFIYSGSEHIEEAKAYFEFMARPENLNALIENEPTFNALPFADTVSVDADYAKEYVTTWADSMTVMQAAVSYIDPQWMDISKDLQMLYLDQLTEEDVLANMDERRATQAEQNNDPAWN